MNIAIIMAGGIGSRSGQQVPKQFVNVLGKPIIIYTLEKFQAQEEIDAIEVVCLEGWEHVLKAYAKQFGIAKLNWIIPGGNSIQESIYNGLLYLKDICKMHDLVVIHDGIRPMLEPEILTDCIQTCRIYGNGVTALPVYEQIFQIKGSNVADRYIKRENLRVLQTPQAYFHGEIMEAYETAFQNGIGVHSSAYANTLMADLGKQLYLSKGSTRNIKITTSDDIKILKAMIKIQQGTR